MWSRRSGGRGSRRVGKDADWLGDIDAEDDDWLGDFGEDESPAKTRLAPSLQSLTEDSPPSFMIPTQSGRKGGVVTRARPAFGGGPPGMLRLAPRHKIALAAVTLGSFLILAAFTYGFIDRLGSLGYVGAFAISLLTSATIILPAPGAALIFVMAEKLDPWLLGLASGIGGGLGAITAYAAGAAGRNAIRRQRVQGLLSRLFRSRWGPFLLFSFTLVPFLPMDLISVMAGAVRYPIPKYLAWVTSASIVKMVLIALAGVFASGWLLEQVQLWTGAGPKGA